MPVPTPTHPNETYIRHGYRPSAISVDIEGCSSRRLDVMRHKILEFGGTSYNLSTVHNPYRRNRMFPCRAFHSFRSTATLYPDCLTGCLFRDQLRRRCSVFLPPLIEYSMSWFPYDSELYIGTVRFRAILNASLGWMSLRAH